MDFGPGQSVVIVSEMLAAPLHAVLLNPKRERCADCGGVLWHVALDNRVHADVCESALTRPN